MTAHRYWRIRLVEKNGDPMAASEIEMHTSIGGANVCTGGTPIGDSYYANSPDYAMVNAFDGNTNSVWASTNAGTGAYIGYDFGAGNEKEILEVSYRARDTYSGQTPSVAVLEWSDDASTWTIAFKIHYGSFASGETKVRSQVPPLTNPGRNPHKFWRIYHPNFTNDYCAGVMAELRGAPGGDNLVATQLFRAFDAGHYSDWTASRLYDNDPSTTYAANGAGWAAAEFLNPVTIEEFTWTSRSDSGNNFQVPVSGSMDYSDDGVTWNNTWLWSFPAFTAGETKTATNPNYSQSGSNLVRRRQSIIVT